MKTTYVIDYNVISKLKLQILPPKKYIDYFFSRDRMIRWEPETNKFIDYRGLIDISFTYELLLNPDDAKKEINIKNVNFLVRRKQMSEYCFDEKNEWGKIWHVCAEDVKNHTKIFEEFHIVFDTKLEISPPFSFKTVFYGNIYDYIVSKEIQEREDPS